MCYLKFNEKDLVTDFITERLEYRYDTQLANDKRYYSRLVTDADGHRALVYITCFDSPSLHVIGESWDSANLVMDVVNCLTTDINDNIQPVTNVVGECEMSIKYRYKD